MQPFIHLEGVRKVYRSGKAEHLAISDASFDVMPGELVSLEDLGFDIDELNEQFGEYFMSLGEYNGQHYGILLVEWGVGTTVASTMLTIFYHFTGREPDIDQEDW